MPIRNIDISRLSRLSRLEINPGEHESLLTDLNAIVDYFDILDKIEYPDDRPLAHKAAKDVNDWRDDVVGESLSVADATKNSQENRRGLFAVPRVIPRHGVMSKRPGDEQ